MENGQRVDLDVSKFDEIVCVRVGMDIAAENNDSTFKLELDSIIVELGGGNGRGSGCGGSTLL